MVKFTYDQESQKIHVTLDMNESLFILHRINDNLFEKGYTEITLNFPNNSFKIEGVTDD